MFRILAALLACYVIYALTTGRVFAKAGVWGRTYARDKAPHRYWSTIAVYCLLSVALAWIF